eukprot:CAMPEP_0204297194 /NCGR_PEP_ID=MMETSP0468-20130131/72755_1 /ASSEMBLY_ACC=CAM_ASM_000383 /TAXON_ID=2969 /ORGANISM="Oxyrrhis marina" /LENGTH=36 /DNA_ID= /DNA_START= /DNA_END= /DNA_ORIENTATION=
MKNAIGLSSTTLVAMYTHTDMPSTNSRAKNSENTKR